MPFKIVALVLPLSLDTFAVSTALGVAGLSPQRRLRLSLVLALFEAGMPLLGFLCGIALGEGIGGAGSYVAAVVLVATGALMLRDDADDPAAIADVRGASILAIGVSVSIDELAVGFAIGLLGLPLLFVVALIAAQAFTAAQLGSRLGARVGQRLRENAGRVAGAVLICLGLGVAILQVSGHD